MARLTIKDLRIGQPVWLDYQRRFNFGAKAFVEYVAFDWAVIRDSNGKPWFLEADDSVEAYEDQDA